VNLELDNDIDAANLKAQYDMYAKQLLSHIKADIRNPLRYLLITLKPLRGSSVGVQPPTDAEKSPA
jgi:hypothetical protein